MINKKNIENSGSTYIIEQPSAIKALALSALAQRLQKCLGGIAIGEGDFDEVQLEADLNKLLKGNELVKIVTGTSKNGLVTAKTISSDADLPIDIGSLGELIGDILMFMFQLDEEVPTAGGETEGK